MKEQITFNDCICTLGKLSSCYDQPVPAEVCRHCGWELHERQRRKETLNEYGLTKKKSGLYGVCEPKSQKKQKKKTERPVKGRTVSGRTLGLNLDPVRKDK